MYFKRNHYYMYISTVYTYMKDNARQMHTPKAASDFHRKNYNNFIRFSFLLPAQVAYREAMRNISLYLGGASLTSTGLEGQLGRLEAAAVVPVQWSDLTSLSPSSVFQPGFVGLEQLRTVLEDLVGGMYMFLNER